MKRFLPAAIAALALMLVAADVDAAKRFGGGGNLGRQRAVPASPNTTRNAAPSATPAKPAQAQPAAAPGAPAPQPTFMGRWGGFLAGIGIGVLLTSLFGAQMGPVVGLVAAMLLGFIVLAFLMRLFARRAQPESAAPGFAGIGSAMNDARPSASRAGIVPAIGGALAQSQRAIPAGEVDAFLRVAKTSFLRMQAANDAKALDDIRDYTTPEMYAEIAMQLKERGDAPQKTEVVDLEAQLLDDAIEGDYAWASVRFSGSMREAPGAPAEAFDEVWNVRKDLRDANPAWLIAGIQQFPLAA